jgi:hypothetical protein
MTGGDDLGLDLRLVALDVDDLGAVDGADRLGDPVGPGRMARRRQHGLAAERLHRLQDPVVVGRDHDAVEPGHLRTCS